MYKGKSILVYLLVMASMLSYSQNPIVNKFRDSTWFANGVRFDSAIYLIKGASNGKVLTSDASGRATWQTFSASGVSQGTLNDSATALNNRINLKASIQNLADTSNVLRALIATKGTGTVTSVATGIGLSGGTITTSGTLVVDTSTIVSKAFLAARGYTTNTGTVTSVATDATMTGGTITSSGTLKVDTTIISTKANVTGLVQGKQDNLVSGTNIKTVNSTTLLGSGNIVTPDAQTLTAGTNTLTISGGNTVNLNRKVDTSYQIKNTARDSTCQITVINGISYRSCTKDTISTLTATSTTTFTNKRITVRVDSTTSSATPTINTDNVDTYKLTAQAADITSFTTNLTGTPTDDQILHIVIIGTGARAITWGSKFESSTVTLPTTTVGTARLDVYFIWNTATSKWRCGGVW